MKKVILLCALLAIFTFSVLAEETDGNTVTGKTDQGLVVLKSNDGNFQLELDGRMNLGAAIYSGNDNPMGNGTEVRRARLALKPTWKAWTAQFDLDFKDNAVEIKDMWVGYNGFKNMQIKIGNHKGQWSMEEVTSSRYITFMERGLPNAFAPDRRLGVSVAKWGKQWRAFAGVFGQLAGDVDATGENEALGYNFRLTGVPLFTDNGFVHLGVAFGHCAPSAGSGDTVKFNSRPESHVTMNKYLSTGKIKNVDSWDEYGLEFAASRGPVLLQGEYTWVNVNRNSDKPTAKFNGYYAFVSWFLTGEKRPYSVEEGEAAGRIIPKKKSGAFELAARVSCLDLNDEDSSLIMGGKGNNVTFAANWYPYANLTFSVNYILVNNDAYATGNKSFTGNDDFNVLQFGMRFVF
jgi:phosphate-selective porin OprO and OprP